MKHIRPAAVLLGCLGLAVLPVQAEAQQGNRVVANDAPWQLIVELDERFTFIAHDSLENCRHMAEAIPVRYNYSFSASCVDRTGQNSKLYFCDGKQVQYGGNRCKEASHARPLSAQPAVR